MARGRRAHDDVPQVGPAPPALLKDGLLARRWKTLPRQQPLRRHHRQQSGRDDYRSGMLEIAGLVVSGISLLNDLFGTTSWSDRDWLPVALEKLVLPGAGERLCVGIGG